MSENLSNMEKGTRPSKVAESLCLFQPSGDSKKIAIESGFEENPASVDIKYSLQRKNKREQGLALILVLTAVAILSIMLTDMSESSSTAFVVAVHGRDHLRAEYMAKSGLNLTRLLVQKEPEIRRLIGPLYQGMMGRKLPQLPIWNYAKNLLWPFCESGTLEDRAESSFDFSNVEGLEETPGSCEVTAIAENSKINVNAPLSIRPEAAKKNIAMQLYSLMGGYQPESPYDPLFSERDVYGNFNTRGDIISAMIDWWDFDTNRTTFDPGTNEIAEAGAEDDVYSRYDDPYKTKNAPFDSVEEIRLVRGIDDVFWATFVEPDPGNFLSRSLTVYDTGAININDASPQVLIAQLCSFVGESTLCVDPLETAKFIQIIQTLRMLIPLPIFTSGTDLIKFVEGKGGATDVYPMLKGFLGEENPLLFQPIEVSSQVEKEIAKGFSSKASILSIQSVGISGRAQVQIKAVVNFSERWIPPPPNSGKMPGLGVVQHYRVD